MENVDTSRRVSAILGSLLYLFLFLAWFFLPAAHESIELWYAAYTGSNVPNLHGMLVLPLWLAHIGASVSPKWVAAPFVVVWGLSLPIMFYAAHLLVRKPEESTSFFHVIPAMALLSPLWIVLPLVSPDAVVAAFLALLLYVVLLRIRKDEAISLGGAIIVGILMGLFLISHVSAWIASAIFFVWMSKERWLFSIRGLVVVVISAISLLSVLYVHPISIASIKELVWPQEYSFAVMSGNLSKLMLMANLAVLIFLFIGIFGMLARFFRISGAPWRLLFALVVVYSFLTGLNAGTKIPDTLDSLEFMPYFFLFAISGTAAVFTESAQRPFARYKRFLLYLWSALIVFFGISIYVGYSYKDLLFAQSKNEVETIRNKVADVSDAFKLPILAIEDGCANAAYVLGSPDLIRCTHSTKDLLNIKTTYIAYFKGHSPISPSGFECHPIAGEFYECKSSNRGLVVPPAEPSLPSNEKPDKPQPVIEAQPKSIEL